VVSNVKKVWKLAVIGWVLMPISAAPAVEPDDVAVDVVALAVSALCELIWMLSQGYKSL